jgi:hypothetical protein
MKMISLNACLRMTVPDDVTPEQVAEIVQAVQSSAESTIGEGVCEAAVKEHVGVSSEDLAAKIDAVDVWITNDEYTLDEV